MCSIFILLVAACSGVFTDSTKTQGVLINITVVFFQQKYLLLKLHKLYSYIAGNGSL